MKWALTILCVAIASSVAATRYHELVAFCGASDQFGVHAIRYGIPACVAIWCAAIVFGKPWAPELTAGDPMFWIQMMPVAFAFIACFCLNPQYYPSVPGTIADKLMLHPFYRIESCLMFVVIAGSVVPFMRLLERLGE